MRLDDPLRETLLLAACQAGEMLPQNPELPADVFTACLTTPIKVRLSIILSRVDSPHRLLRNYHFVAIVISGRILQSRFEYPQNLSKVLLVFLSNDNLQSSLLSRLDHPQQVLRVDSPHHLLRVLLLCSHHLIWFTTPTTIWVSTSFVKGAGFWRNDNL